MEARRIHIFIGCEVKNMRAEINRQIELVQILIFLSKCNERTKQSLNNKTYCESIKQHFAPFENHYTVLKTRELICKNNFIHIKPLRAILCIDKIVDDPSDKLHEWGKLVLQFAEQSAFDNFYANQSDYYNWIIENMNKCDFNIWIGFIEDYFRQKPDFYKLIICPIAGSYGFNINNVSYSVRSMICDELGLIGKEMVAVDGSKFRANNSRMAYHNEKKLEKKIEHYNEAAEKYLTLLDNCDIQEKESSKVKLSRVEIEEKINGINKRLAELEVLKQQVKENGSIYETDPDSRMMKTNNNGCDICHNVQIAVDDKNHLVVAVDVTREPVDKEQFHNIALQAKEELGVETITAIADKGYYSASQFAKCKEDNIIPIVSKADHSHMAATKEYVKSQFQYDAEQNGYICPQGHLLKAYNQRKKNPKYADHVRYRNLEACASVL